MIWLHRLFPHPLFSLSLLVVWLALVNSLSPGEIILGALLAVALPRLTSPFWPEHLRMRRAGRLVAYAVVVLWDIILANLAVARLILGPTRNLRPRFVILPLELEQPVAVALLANTISLTPGTVSADLSRDGRLLLLHCLDVDDEQQLIERIKARYERRLLEVFP